VLAELVAASSLLTPWSVCFFGGGHSSSSDEWITMVSLPVSLEYSSCTLTVCVLRLRILSPSELTLPKFGLQVPKSASTAASSVSASVVASPAHTTSDAADAVVPSENASTTSIECQRRGLHLGPSLGCRKSNFVLPRAPHTAESVMRILSMRSCSPQSSFLSVLMMATHVPNEGSLHMSTVKSVQSYGAFCSLEGVGMDGLLHISQMPRGQVPSVEAAVSVGDRVRVRVLSVDNNKSDKIALSVLGVKQAADAPAALRWMPPQALGTPPSAEELGQLDCVALSFVRSGGAGGQNVNKLATKVEARLQLSDCPWPEGVRQRLQGKATGGGVVIVASDKHRTQGANRKDALERLAALVAEAWRPPKTRRQREGISASAKRARRNEKAKTSQRKQSRSAARRGVFDWIAPPLPLTAAVSRMLARRRGLLALGLCSVGAVAAPVMARESSRECRDMKWAPSPLYTTQ
jgi:ribosome-associated protein